MGSENAANTALRLDADCRRSREADVGETLQRATEGGKSSSASVSESASETVISSSGLRENDESAISNGCRNEASADLRAKTRTDSTDCAVHSARDRPGNLPPIEEYLWTMDRIAVNNKLSPRRRRILREVTSRYGPCREHASASCDLPACRMSRSPVHPHDVKRASNVRTREVDEGNCDSERCSLIDSETVPATSVQSIPKPNRTTSNVTGESDCRSEAREDQDGTKRHSSLTDTTLGPGTSKICSDTARQNEDSAQHTWPDVKSELDGSPESACGLESLAIDSPFSNFSLRHAKQSNALWRRVVEAEEILEESKSPLPRECEPSTSKSIARKRDAHERCEKSGVHFADECTKSARADASSFKKKTEDTKEETVEPESACKCQ